MTARLGPDRAYHRATVTLAPCGTLLLVIDPARPLSGVS